jgi:hypothetical protein
MIRIQEKKGAGHSACQEVGVVHLVQISRSRRAAWMLAGLLALSCSSKQIPIGEQTGFGGSNRGQAGSGGGGSAGSGGSGEGGSPGSGGSPGVGGGSGGADAASGGTSGSDAGSGTDAGSCPGSFTTALIKSCSTAADCLLAPHFDCCGNVIVAVRTGTDASFATAQQNFESCVPGCRLRGCDHADRAEDGQTLTAPGQAFAAQCQSGLCTSVVTTGPTSDCGGRKCLTGEICVQLGRYPGTFTPDAGPPTTTPTCVVVPAACGANQPSCATCIVSAFGCATPGTCRDLGPQTFECILPGA